MFHSVQYLALNRTAFFSIPLSNYVVTQPTFHSYL